MTLNWTAEDVERHNKRVKAGRSKGAKAPEPSAPKKLQALGRLQKGEMNKTEARYAAYLDLQMHAGAVLWYKFEGIKLMLAKNTSITIDFAVLTADSVLTMIDVKGAKAVFTDDARAKMKVAAAMYPFVFKAVYPQTKAEGGGWQYEDF